MTAFEDFVNTELPLRTSIAALPTNLNYPRFTGVGRALEERTPQQVADHLEPLIDHDNLLNYLASEHFSEASIDHTNISNIGTNSHSAIDTHIADTSDPHGAIMSVSTQVTTPKIKNSGDVTLEADNNAATSTVFVTNPDIIQKADLDVERNIIVGGDAILSDENFIRTGTSDGSDNESIGIAGGGSLSNLRGSFVRVSGNEDANTGKLFLTAGNVAGGEIRLSVGGSTKATLDDNGLLGLGTLSPQKDFHISKSVPTIRLSDSDAATDQAVATLIELYRGDNTNRVGFWGMASSGNDVMALATDYAAGVIQLKTGNNVLALAIDSSQNFDFQAGNLNTTGDFAFSGAGPHSIGGGTDTKNQLTLTGTYSPATGTAAAFFMDTILNAVANQTTIGMRLKCTLNEAASGTHAHFNTLHARIAASNKSYALVGALLVIQALLRFAIQESTYRPTRRGVSNESHESP